MEMTTLLLTHLQKENPKIPLATLLGALSHHLSLHLPSPAPLAAATLSSPFFLSRPQTHQKLQGLVTVFRHALNAKHQVLVKSTEQRWTVANAIFYKTVQSGVEAWVRDLLEGLRGGQPVLRLSCLVGLLLGLRDLEQVQVEVEDEIILALAEVMDIHDRAVSGSGWEKEFHEHDTSLSLALILASQSLPFLPTAKLQAVPLPSLGYLLTSVIASAFAHGTFLASLPEFNPAEPIYIPGHSSFAQSIQDMVSTPVMASIAGLSKLTSVVLGTLIDSPDASLQEASEALEVYRQMAERIEQDWKQSKLSVIRNDEAIASSTRDLMKTVWWLLKTFLFSTIMVADGVLGSVVFAKPHRKHQDMLGFTVRSLAETVLRTLFHISFVVSQFGGVIATAREDPGFIELRKVFYLAIDILSSGELLHEHESIEQREACECFVKELIDNLGRSSDSADRTKHDAIPFEQAKTAYALACIEQLVPLLSDRCLKDRVWDLCVPFLTEPSHRETFESAHSVILAICASHAQQQQLPRRPPPHRVTWSKPVAVPEIHQHDQVLDGDFRTPDLLGFVPRMVPFYAQCLIENSEDGHLSSPQLRLAYSALVRSASASTAAFGSSTHESFELSWYCIELILDKIRQLATEEANMGNVKERLHRLRLMLISTVPSLPLPLMIRVLDEVRDIIVNVGEVPVRTELADALFVEILENVGDREKEASMRWWHANRLKLAQSMSPGESRVAGATERDDRACTSVTPRL